MKEDLKEIMSKERFTPTNGDIERIAKELIELISDSTTKLEKIPETVLDLMSKTDNLVDKIKMEKWAKETNKEFKRLAKALNVDYKECFKFDKKTGKVTTDDLTIFNIMNEYGKRTESLIETNEYFFVRDLKSLDKSLSKPELEKMTKEYIKEKEKEETFILWTTYLYHMISTSAFFDEVMNELIESQDGEGSEWESKLELFEKVHKTHWRALRKIVESLPYISDTLNKQTKELNIVNKALSKAKEVADRSKASADELILTSKELAKIKTDYENLEKKLELKDKRLQSKDKLIEHYLLRAAETDKELNKVRSQEPKPDQTAINKLTLENATLKANLNGCNEHIKSLNSKIESLMNQIEDLNKENSDKYPQVPCHIGYFKPDGTFKEVNTGEDTKYKDTDFIEDGQKILYGIIYGISKETEKIVYSSSIHQRDLFKYNSSYYSVKLCKEDIPKNAPVTSLVIVNDNGTFMIVHQSRFTTSQIREMTKAPKTAVDGYVSDVINGTAIIENLDHTRDLLIDSGLSQYDYVLYDEETKEIYYQSDDTLIYESDSESELVVMWTPTSGTIVSTDQAMTGIRNNTNMIFDYGDVARVSLLTNNILQIQKEYDLPTQVQNKLKTTKQDRKFVANKTELTDTVLVLGNSGFFSAYKQALNSIGVNCRMLNGYTSTPMVLREARKTGKVILTPSHCSHGNFWALKEEESILFSTSGQGATSIANAYKDMANEEKIFKGSGARNGSGNCSNGSGF